MQYRQKLLLIVMSFILASCAMTPKATRDTSAIDNIQQELKDIDDERQAPPVMPSDQIDSALLPPLFANNSSAMIEERFDIAVTGVDATRFFMGLVKGTDYNMVVHPGVEGDISLELNNVTIDEVMEITRDVYGYPFKQNGKLYQVLPGGLRSEIFKIDYLSLKRSGVSETQVTNGSVTSAGSSSSSSSNNTNSSGNENNNSGTQGTVGAQIRTETESDFWGELQQTLEVLVGSGDGRNVMVTPQAGIIVIRAMSDEIEVAEDFLRRAELIMRRQVVLEAKILEVQLSDGYQTGINWSAVADLNSNPLNFDIAGSSVVSPNAIGGAFTSTLNTDDFYGVIELLETQGSVQVLSSPRISTVNNQKAVIKVGEDEFFVTEVSNTTTTSSGITTSNPEVELTPFFSGIALDVTPQISETGEIILHVHPSISEVEDQTKTITVGGEILELPLALSTIRETDSIVYARSGQVIVLGGLMQDKSIDDNSGAPVIGDIPILGHLFNQQRNSTEKNELVILLKPTIMGPDGLDEPIHSSQQRFQEFRETLDNHYFKRDSDKDADEE